MPDISVYEVGSVIDRAAVARLSEFEICSVEFTAPAESITTDPPLLSAIAAETASAVEYQAFSPTIGPEFYMEDRLSGWPKMPVRQISAAFSPAFTARSSLTSPAYSGTGQFGWQLSKRTPSYSFSGVLTQQSVGLTLSKRQPVRSIEAAFGSSLNGRMPVRTVAINLYTDAILTLSKSLPGWTGYGEILGPQVFALDARIPVRIASISMSMTQDLMTLSRKIPGAYKISAAGHEVAAFNLDGIMPVRRLSLSSGVYSVSADLSGNMPVWLVSTTGELNYRAVFTEFILRYNRP